MQSAIWNRPFYLDTSRSLTLKRSFWIGLFVFLFLWIFRPFGLDRLHSGILNITLGFGAVSFAITFLLGLILSYIFPQEKADQWTVGKEILVNLLHLFFIGLGNVLFANITGMTDLRLLNIIIFQFFTLAVGVFPVTIVILLKERFSSQRYRHHAEDINSGMSIPAESQEQNDRIILSLSSQNAGEELKLEARDLLFVRAANNYVEVLHRVQDQTKTTLLRNTLKKIEEDIGPHPDFFRCHKSYIVNLRQIGYLSGNAQGYKLHLRDPAFKIPVSRQYNDRIKTLLADRH